MSPVLDVLRVRDYRLLWVGQSVSFLGDQFHMVAMPWLVLQLTGDPLQLGLVLAVAGLPRALFMVVGGVWADRYSPRRIMLVSDILRFLAVGALAVATLVGAVQMWMVYAVALVVGTLSGFFVPAANASIPRLVEDRGLESGNALMRIAEQSAQFLGPAAAGILIAVFGREVVGAEEVASLTGIGIAQAVDACTFAVSALSLALIRGLAAIEGGASQRPVKALVEGARFVWGSARFRWMFLIIAFANFFVSGPLLVGVPVLADSRLAEGAAAFGIIMSAYAAGNLVGMVGAGTLPRMRAGVMGAVTVALFLAFGVALATLSAVGSLWHAVPLMVAVGVGNGYLAISLLSYLQRITPREMMGRLMGMLMFAMFGLTPLSQAVSGWVVRGDLNLLFIGAGACLALTAVVAALRPEVRTLGAEGEVSFAV